MTVKQKTRVLSVYLSVKRQNKWINKAESNLKSYFCSLCMWARCCFYLKVTCCYVIIMWPPVPWQAIPFYLSLHYWGGNRCLIWCFPGFFIFIFFIYLVIFCLDTAHGPLTDWVGPPTSALSWVGDSAGHVKKLDGQQTNTHTGDDIYSEGHRQKLCRYFT